jgi:arylsulfatase A-like enzyme
MMSNRIGPPRTAHGLWQFLAAVAAVLAPGFAVAADKRPPNVVVLLADDLGYGDIGVHGCKDIPTPNIDAMAARGVRCTNGYVSGPYCSPTRAGLLTGRYQQRFGHEFNPRLLRQGGRGEGLPVEEKTLPQLLRDAGYATGLVGKWHLGEEEQFHPLNRGFQEFYGFLAGSHSYFESDDPNRGPIYRGREKVELDGYLTDVLAREAAAFIDRHKQQPFFLYLAFNAVHTPMEAPERLLQKFAHVADANRRTYCAMTASLDEAVGTVLDKLRAAGLEENTLVFFLSDNGGPVGKFGPNGSRNDPLRGSKGDTWEGGIRVPFLVQWKGTLEPAVYELPVIQLDIAATALDLAGVPTKGVLLDGVNLLPYLKFQASGAPHQRLFWRFGEQMAVREVGGWKLVRASGSATPYGDVPDKPMLFNLLEDIGEQKDLAAEHPDKVRELQAAWDRWNGELPRPRWPATLGGKALGTK